MQLSAFRQFLENIGPVAPGSHAVQFLDGNDVRTGVVDHIGYTLIITYTVHAIGVTDVVGHQAQHIFSLG